MHRILFVRKFKKKSGGQIKVRDYFRHCLDHSDWEAELYFTPDSTWQGSGFWDFAPKERVVTEVHFGGYDCIFLAGRDWEYVPEIPEGFPVINFIQHVKHADKSDKRHKHLCKPAWRICVSREVADAIAPYANGEISVIKNGISLEIFKQDAAKRENSILIWGRKNPNLGAILYEKLKCQRKEVELLLDFLPRKEFARRLGETDIFVALPHETEGFYLPALEAMASGCVVVCSDAIGNRSFCKHKETCLTPKFDDFDEHLRMINHFFADALKRENIRQQGIAVAQTFSLASEREVFYKFLAKFTGTQTSFVC